MGGSLTPEDLAERILARRTRTGTFVVGITGSVASGKSTLAERLHDLLAAGGLKVDRVASDGFLLANAILDARGLSLRKGFPETYDLAALTGALAAAKRGPVRFPAYSHATYDHDPASDRSVERPDILIIEGLALGLDRPPAPGALDCLVYLDAQEDHLEAWFVARFLDFWQAAETDPTSFYARFRNLDRAGAEGVARAVWSGINLPNLRAHIAPVRAHADLVVLKDANHAIVDIDERTRSES
jgi:type I pantothenate kinase